MQTTLGSLRRLRDDRRTQSLFARYLAIGGFVFCIDVGSFQTLVKAGLFLPAATSLSFLLAVSTHFTLNRFFNFRNFDRTIVQQAGTYVVVAGLALLIQNAAVLSGVHLFGLSPIVAKIVGIAINVPIGFFGHRYLTFGRGIVATLQRRRAATPGSPH
jgi:putative flippase GtrA